MLLNFQISGPNLVEPNAFGPVLVCAPGFPMNGQTRVCFEPKPEAEKGKRNLQLRVTSNDVVFDPGSGKEIETRFS